MNIDNEKFKAFVEQLQAGIFRLELKNIDSIDINLPIEEQIDLMLNHFYIVDANDYLANMFGLKSNKELIEHKLSEFIYISENSKKAFFKDIIKSNYKKSEFEISNAKIYQRNINVYLQCNTTCIIENNKLISIWGVLRDITDKKISEKSLEESENKYKTIIEEIPNIVWTSKPNGNLNFYNQRLYKYTGVKFEDIKNWGWTKILHPDDIQRTSEIWNKSIITGDRFEIEFRLRRSDGAYRWFISRAIPLKDSNGNIIKWFGISTDIDYGKNLEDRLKKKNDDLDSFISIASHDLKTPVANIEGLVEILPSLIDAKCKKDNELLKIFNMIKSSIDKFKKNLLGMIEITNAEQQSNNIEVNNIKDVIHEVESILEKQIKDTNTIINTDIKENKITFSKKNLQSIIYNLISNSIKYRSPDRSPVIDIKTKVENEYLILSVKDNGLGFKEKYINKVFTEFKRFHKDIEGTGIGLYIIKSIITKAGGKVELYSKHNQYSLFKVYFKIT